MKRITIWRKRINEPERDWFSIHNHIEDGWVTGDKPEPLNKDFKQQKDWVKANWIKHFGYLINGRVVLMEDILWCW